MPGVHSEPYRFQVSISLRLDYGDRDDQPRTKDDLKARAETYKEVMRDVLRDVFSADSEISTDYVWIGSAYTGHTATMLLESRQQWEDACKVFGQFADDVEDWIAEDLAIKEHLTREAVSVRVRTAKESKMTPASPSDDVHSVIQRVDNQYKRMRRMTALIAGLALAFGIIASAAWWNYWFLREEVRLLREDQAAPTPAASSAAPPEVIVLSSPGQQVRVIDRNGREWRGQSYDSRP